MPAPAKIAELVKRFEEHREAYLSGAYNETQLRREFIDPFFKALGWDIDNEGGSAEAYKDVIHEDAIKIGAPDYCFRIGGMRKFFVEAKKPSIDLKTDFHPAFQLRCYAWSSKLPLSILTDFEEFAVYDCRVKPGKIDKPAIARIKYYTYKDYLGKWDEIADIFSHDAVRKGAFDKFAGGKGRRGTDEVDQAFLAEIQSWREELAKNIALLNPKLTNRELNFVVQRTIDRIIFLRICEDRGIEDERTLLGLINGPNIYDRLLEVYEKADQRYNSGIFHFHPEKGRREAPDELSLKITIDDKVLKGIFKNLYYPESSYAFAVMPVEILGQVYEQFLGQVIHLTEGHHARIEEKPEVKKAGGVYYTPAYIVDYIVKNTVGKLVEGKTPRQVAKLRILDPACGSGSFLIGAYQFLLDWHRDWYVKDASEKWFKGKEPVIYERGEKDWRLTVDEKKRILLNNIYGVDIDSQAVEVTKLSLLLKVLEGESGEAISRQYRFIHERVLPDLGENIKCGNSLIGPDIYTTDSGKALNDEEKFRINAFDWQREFPEIMSAGGFDAVIGNPPYVRPHNIPAETKEMLWATYKTFVAKSDLYSCFMERGLFLMRAGGLFSFIVPHTWTSLESFTQIRGLILHGANIQKLVHLPKKVFSNAVVETCVFVLKKFGKEKGAGSLITVEGLDSGGKVIFDRQFSQQTIEQAHLYNFQLYGHELSGSILEKIKLKGRPLSEIVSFVYGFKTADDEKFIHSTRKHPESKPFIRSAAIYRYGHEDPQEYVWYVPEKMIQNKTTARPGDALRFEAEKIIVARMGKQLVATYDPGGLYVKDAMLLLSGGDGCSLKYILGVINSRLLDYFYREFFITIDVLKNALLSLPISQINPKRADDKGCYNKIVELVTAILALNIKLQAVRTDHEKTALQRQIDATDAEIDKMVYQLYGLTEDEIKIVENSAK
jgi:type I restriction-modification system DNA methylase subunit